MALVMHRPEEGLFVVEGEEASLRYRRDGGRLVLFSTWVAPASRGRGLAAELVEAAFRWAESEALTVVPLCSYVETFLCRNPEWRRLVREAAPRGDE